MSSCGNLVNKDVLGHFEVEILHRIGTKKLETWVDDVQVKSNQKFRFLFDYVMVEIN